MSKLDEHKKAIEQWDALVAWLNSKPVTSSAHTAGRPMYWVDGRDTAGSNIGDRTRGHFLAAVAEAWPLIDARMRALAQADVDAAGEAAKAECLAFLNETRG